MSNGAGEALRLVAVRRAAGVSLVATTLVVVAKLVAAYFSHSVSVLAEGAQSTVDVVISLAAIVTVTIASKPPDEDHPYGHGRLEVLAGATQMLIIVVTAGMIAWQATMRLHNPQPIDADIGIVVMAAAAVSNLLVRQHLVSVATRYGSASLRGEGEHLRSDALASVGVVVGLVATKLTNNPVLDPLFALGFTGLGVFFAIRQLVVLGHQLMDGALPPADVQKVKDALATHPHVRGYHNLRTRQTGELRIVTLHCMLDDDLSFIEAHELAEGVETDVSKALGGALVTVHYEPYQAELAHQAAHHSGESA